MIKDYSSQKEEKLIIRERGKIHQITVADIEIIHSESGISTVIKTDGKNIVISKNLTFFEKELAKYGFARANRNKIINCAFVSTFDLKNKKIITTDEKTIKISCRNLKTFIEIFKNVNTLKVKK